MERSRTVRYAWLIIPLASIVPALLDAGQMWLKEALDQSPGIHWGNVTFQGMEWLFLGALTPIAWYLARAFPIGRSNWRRALIAHGAGALVLCTGWATLGIGLGRLVDHWVAAGPLQQAYANWLLTSIPWSVVMYFTVLGCVYAFAYYHEARERQVQAALLGARLSEARLNALRMQIHPHFLFNSLNTVLVLVRENQTRAASRLIEILGDMFRALLRPDRPQEIRLEEEIRFMKEYLEIEFMRFPDRLRVDWSIGEVAGDALIPDMLLQPLVENAIRHGVARREDASRLEIAAQIDRNVLRLSVSDEGAATEPAPGEGVGLTNTRERLLALYGTAASLTLETLPGGGTRATVELPFRKAVP